MHVNILTARVLVPLVLFLTVFNLFDANAKPLKKTGEVLLDEETLPSAKMTKVENGIYKCHHHRSDSSYHHRQRRYVASPFKFHTMVVRWHVTNFSAKLSTDDQLSVFQEAFDKWHTVSRLNFSYTNNVTEAQIKISFLTNHFHDGQGRTLAHAYNPHPSNGFPGEIHFDEDENWVTTATGGVNLRAVALHEIGHAIGIKHSDVVQAVMSDIIANNNTQLHDDDISAIRSMYGQYGNCEVGDITAVLHDRFGDYSDTVLVIKKDKVYRISTDNGQIVEENHGAWPKNTRDYYRATDSIYDKVFPLRAAFYAKGDHYVYLFGQNHFIRKIPKEDPDLTNGRYYDFKDIMTWKKNSNGHWVKVPEGPLPYSPMNIFHTPDFFKNFLTNNASFGASFELGCCFWQHFFMNGTHYKMSLHNFNNYVIEDMSVNFPGVPRNPNASWYDLINNEWYFFEEDRYYKLDASLGKYTDQGPISLLWSSLCD